MFHELNHILIGKRNNRRYFAYQLKYDSVHGTFKGEISSKKSKPDLEFDDTLVINGEETKCIIASKDPAQLPWKELEVDYVIESTGLFTDSEKAKGHITAGAKKSNYFCTWKRECKNCCFGS